MPEADGSTALGLFGGTFDPVHLGHLRLAEEARERLGLARVRWIPAGDPRHRQAPVCSGEHRLAMVDLALRGNPGFELDPHEVRSGRPSYTVETLERLRTELGAARPLVLILGADAFAGLESWHRWSELFDLAHIALASRAGQHPDPARLPEALGRELARRRSPDPSALTGQPAGAILTFDMSALDISATAIRARLAQRASCRYLVPDAVLDYIDLHHLYR